MQTEFFSLVTRNVATREILSRWSLLNLPNGWLVAGCLFQTIWNLQAGRSPGAGIKDYDIFYFDSSDLSAEAESRVQAHADFVLGDLGVEVEVANQARVHTWYPGHFGKPCPQLATVEEGIRRFLVLETCVATRPDEVYSPYGLAGIYAGTLTANPLTPHPELFASKVASYRERWNWLRVQS